MLRKQALTSGMYKMFQYWTGGVDLGNGQAPPAQNRALTEQEVLALQLQEKASRQAQAAQAAQQQQQQQQQLLQSPQVLPLQTPQVKNKRFIRHSL